VLVLIINRANRSNGVTAAVVVLEVLAEALVRAEIVTMFLKKRRVYLKRIRLRLFAFSEANSNMEISALVYTGVLFLIVDNSSRRFYTIISNEHMLIRREAIMMKNSDFGKRSYSRRSCGHEVRPEQNIS
jgi:hypothetical protein